MIELPSISVVIPTLNAAKVLDLCLASIAGQDYPKELIEIIVADGGSVDGTVATAEKYGARVLPNPLKTGEAGKAVAIKNANNDLVALIDSDNILPQKDWFLRMVEPFADPEIIGAEPIEYTWRKEDGFITRYCALIGMNDPLCLFLGNYDRYSWLTGLWTGLHVESDDRGRWLKVSFKDDVLPTIGANGTIFRGRVLEELGGGPRFFDIDILPRAIKLWGGATVAKVKVGIVHLYCGASIKMFIKKQDRRISDFAFNQKIGGRAYEWHKQNKKGLIKFIIYAVTFFPPLLQSLRGYLRKPDRAWFFHPLACFLTLFIYTHGVFTGLRSPREANRQAYSQG